MDYKSAGVDIEAGYESVELMKKFVKGTMRPEVLGGLGGFSGAFSLEKIKEINPDIILKEDAFTPLLSFLNKSGAGMAAPRILDENGELIKAYRLDPTPFDMFIRMFLKGMFKKRKAKHTMQGMDYTKPFKVPFVQGSFLVIRTELFKKLHGFDERFFLYMEDADLCRRVNSVSNLIYCPDASVVHLWGQGSHKSMKLFRMHVSSMIKYFKKWK